MRRIIVSFLLITTALFKSVEASASPFLTAYDRIMMAVARRDEKALSKMVSEGVNINAVNSSGQTALCTTLSRQDRAGYKMLFNQGATVHTPCIRQIHPQTLRSFYLSNPDLGHYVDGRIMVPEVAQPTASSSTPAISGIPGPNMGELILAGAAVGAVALIGTGGKGSDGGGGGVPEDSSLYKPVETGLTLEDFPTLGGYWKKIEEFDSEDESNEYRENYYKNLAKNNKPWAEAQSKKYAWEYNGGGEWVAYDIDYDESDASYTKSYLLVNPVAYLPMVNAASAWIRGYTGYVVDRSDASKPKITDKKVKVAVMDTGLEVDSYAHGQLKANISKTRLNYSYGPCSANNSKKCWAFNSTDGYAYLTTGVNQIITDVPEDYEDKYNVRIWSEEWRQGKVTTVDTNRLWNNYASAFAPVCSATVTVNCLKKEGSSVTYVVESGGITYSAPSDKVWAEYTAKYGEKGYIYDENDPTPGLLYDDDLWDGEDHGTHVSGIIASARDGVAMAGVAPNAEIIPVRADFQMNHVMNHLKDVVEKTDAQVINLSLGNEVYLSSTAEGNKSLWDSFSDDEEAGYQAAAKKSTVLVFAAGNEGKSSPHEYTVAPLIGESDDIKTNYAKSIYKNLLISVVAVDENKKIAYFGTEDGVRYESNRCGPSSMYCLAAPGGTQSVPVGSTVIGNTYAFGSGTSQATPVVSGAVAVLMGAFPFLKPQQVVQILFETADYLKPTEDEIQAYNTAAEKEGYGENAYEKYTEEGKYNAIYGHGLVNLDKATDPIGVPKISFDTVASSALAIDAASTHVTVPAALAHTLSVLPKNIVVLDKYTRPYAISTSQFVNTEKRTDSLKRSFQSFMAADEKMVEANDHLSFGFTEAPSDSIGLPTGSMTMQMKPTSDMSIRMGYTQDTKSFGGSYADRIVQNPFINMRQTWGTDLAYRVANHWSLTGGFKYGQNGFVDSEVLDKMSDKPMLSVVQTGVRYAPKKSVVFDMSFGQMNEQESLLGLRGDGAFETDGNKTKFISIGTSIMPFDKWQLSASYTYGMTEANDTQTLMKFSRLTSDAFALAALYRPDEQSTYGFKVASPLRVRSGTVTFDLPTARDMYADRLYRTQYTSDMKPNAREYDLSLFFMKQLEESLLLAGEAGVRLHPDHQKQAKPDYQTLFKMQYQY